MKHIVGFSGGIDSQACARWVLNRFPHEDVILTNSNAGGNEHPMTVEFIDWYSTNVHPVVKIESTVADMGTRAKAEIERRGLKPTDPLDFPLLAELKHTFPRRKMQFCTEHLKLRPQQRWIRQNIADEFRRYSGVRREESRNRQARQPIEWDEIFACELFHPLVDWTKQMCFDFVKLHGEQINPLYTLGFNRVGCAPCVNSNKADILSWAQRFPEMIDKVREWETRVGKTFFGPMVPGMDINWVDDVVRWSKTLWGGRNTTCWFFKSLLHANRTTGCANRNLLMQRVIARLLHMANTVPPICNQTEFYKLKDRLLRTHGAFQGHLIQEIRKECWGQRAFDDNGDDYYIECGPKCRRCGGTGIFDIRWVRLEQWTWCGWTFCKPTGDTRIKPNKVDIVGRVEHVKYGRAANEALLWLCLLCGERKLFWKLMRSYSCCGWYWWPLINLQRVTMRLSMWCRIRKCYCGRRYATFGTGRQMCRRCSNNLSVIDDPPF